MKMTFADSVKSGLKNWANFKGTATRTEFWYFYLFTILLNMVTTTIDSIIAPGTDLSGAAMAGAGPPPCRPSSTLPARAALVLHATAQSAHQPDGPLGVFVLDMGKPVKIMDLAERMIADHPEISGFFVVWDTPATAVSTRLQATGRSIVMATVDLGEDVAISLAAGKPFVSVAAQQPFQQGVVAARTTILALLGRTIPAWIALPGVPVARDNVADSFQIVWRKPAPREVLRSLGLTP